MEPCPQNASNLVSSGFLLVLNILAYTGSNLVLLLCAAVPSVADLVTVVLSELDILPMFAPVTNNHIRSIT
jgi:hypothetical protein